MTNPPYYPRFEVPESLRGQPEGAVFQIFTNIRWYHCHTRLRPVRVATTACMGLNDCTRACRLLVSVGQALALGRRLAGRRAVLCGDVSVARVIT
jgi:hypothetical protein